MVALVVETGAGLATANAYCDVTFADSYNAAHPYGLSWLSTPDKSAAIATATMLLDAHLFWNGTRWSEAQALGWPRIGCYNKENELISSDIVPVEVKRATAELARLLGAEDLTAEPADRGISELTLGELSIKFDPSDRKGTLPASVTALVRGLAKVASSFGTSRVVRA